MCRDPYRAPRLPNEHPICPNQSADDPSHSRRVRVHVHVHACLLRLRVTGLAWSNQARCFTRSLLRTNPTESNELC